MPLVFYVISLLIKRKLIRCKTLVNVHEWYPIVSSLFVFERIEISLLSYQPIIQGIICAGSIYNASNLTTIVTRLHVHWFGKNHFEMRCICVGDVVYRQYDVMLFFILMYWCDKNTTIRLCIHFV